MDTRDINAQNLLFLLSAAPLAVGCVITGVDDDTTTSATTATTTTTTTTDTSTTTTATDTSTTTTATDTSTSTDTTEGPMDTTDGTTATTDATTTGPPGTPCEAYAEFYGGCYGEEYAMGALEFCDDYSAYLDGLGVKGCLEAFDEYLVCLTELTCKEFMEKAPCMAESDNYDGVCFPK